MIVKFKLNPLSHVVSGKRIVLLNDSIVRGTTSANLISRLREAGAEKIHMWVTSPPVMNPCYYGIGTPSWIHLITVNLSVEEIEERIGADSLRSISEEGMVKAAQIAEDHLCIACFDDQYPVDPIVLWEEL